MRYTIETAALLTVATSSSDAKVLEVSVVTDWETVSYYGSTETTEQALEAVIAEAAYTYRNQLNLELVVTHTTIPSKESDDLLADHTHVRFLNDDLIMYRNDFS